MKIIILLVFANLVCLFGFSQKIEWADYTYSTANFNSGTGTVTDNAGNVYVLGDITGQLSIQGSVFTNQYGLVDIILIKYDPQGGFLWAKVFGSASNDSPYELAIDVDQNIYASVSIPVTTQMSDTVYTAPFEHQIIQLDTDGNFKRYISKDGFTIALGANSHYVYIAHRFTVEKLDTAFNQIWSRTSSSSIGMRFDDPINPGRLKVADNGHLVVCGQEYGGGGSNTFDTLTLNFSAAPGDEVFVISMDTSGSALWATTLYTANTTLENHGQVIIDNSGNVYVAIRSAGDVIYFANDTLTNLLFPPEYWAVLKYNANGNPQWGNGLYSSSSNAFIYDLLINNQQELMVCGEARGLTHFGNLQLVASPSETITFVSRVSPTGFVHWVKHAEWGSNGSRHFSAMSMTPAGNYIATGHYSGTFRIGCFTPMPGSSGIITCHISEDQEPVPVAVLDVKFEGGVAYFENQSENDDSVKWIFGDGQTDLVKNNPSHAYPIPGYYNACLIAMNDCGSDTACTAITVAGIESISPNHLANTGYHITNISGGFPFTTGTVRFIKNGEPDIVPDDVYFTNPGLIQANLKLDSAALGVWDLVITSGLFNDTLYNALTLEVPDTMNVEVQVSGVGKTLVNTFWPFKIMLTNKSNRTEIGLPVYITVSPDAEILFSYHELNDSATIAAIDSFGNFWTLHDTIANDSVLFAAFLIPYLSPGQTHELNMHMKFSAIGLKSITARTGNSFFSDQNLTDMGLRLSSCNFMPVCLQCAMDFAGFIPGVGCATGALNAGCAIGNGIGGSKGGSATDIIGSLAGAILSCAGPVGAMAKVGAGVAFAAEMTDLLSSANGVSDDCGGNTGCKPFNPDNWTWPNAGALDPNSKTGPIGLTPENYISGKELMHYFIHFENVDTATAPAREVVIRDTIDTTVFNISSFRFTSFSFGDSTYSLDVQDWLFVKEIDLRPAKNIVLRVSGVLDSLNHIATWTFSSYDTLKYNLTSNVNDGFLPPNISRPEGEGYVTYSIEPVQGLQHLQTLTNTASIIFDANTPIETDLFINTVDNVSPVSQVNSNPVVLNDTTFIITWAGTDAHAGINVYDIYISINGNAYFRLFKGTTKTTATINGVLGENYAFYCIATDLADNRELPPTSPDATIFLIGISEINSEIALTVYPNPVSSELTIHSSVIMDKIKVFDLCGKEVFKVETLSKTFSLNVSDYSTGVYFIEINSNKRSRFSKFIKQ